MLALVVLVLVAAAVLAVRLAPAVSQIRRVRRMTAALPGPPMYPVIGHVAGHAIETACFVGLDRLYSWLQQTTAAHGPIFRLVMGHLTFVFVMEPDDMEAVITSDKALDKSLVYRPLEPLMGRGIGTLKGEAWRRHRKAVTPSLHADLLRDYVAVFYRHGAALADALERRAGEVLDVRSLCGDCASGCVCESVMTVEADEHGDEMRTVASHIDKGMDHFVYRVSRPWFLSDWLYKLHRARYAEYAEIRDYSGRLAQRLIEEKKEALRSSAPSPHRKRLTFLEHALSSPDGAALSESELAEECKTMVAVGSGSLKDAMTFIIYTLAIRQDIQDKVRQELRDILGEGRGRAVEHTDLNHMDYTERVIKETLRYFTIVPLFARSVKQDLTLPSGFTLPRGCQVAFWLPHTHMSPKWFPEPDKFDPDRFLPERSRGRHPYAYLPFSAGPRNCIGQRYAMTVMKTVLAALVLRLRFEVPDDGPQRLEDVPLNMDITLNIPGGARVRPQPCCRG